MSQMDEKQWRAFLDAVKTKKKTEVICFILYDIENNKIRRTVAKYLEAKGCFRVQKSVFVAQLHRRVFGEIQKTLRDIQGAYENADSILMVPISEDEIRSMQIIGKALNLSLMLKRHHTLVF